MLETIKEHKMKVLVGSFIVIILGILLIGNLGLLSSGGSSELGSLSETQIITLQNDDERLNSATPEFISATTGSYIETENLDFDENEKDIANISGLTYSIFYPLVENYEKNKEIIADNAKTEDELKKVQAEQEAEEAGDFSANKQLYLDYVTLMQFTNHLPQAASGKYTYDTKFVNKVEKIVLKYGTTNADGKSEESDSVAYEILSLIESQYFVDMNNQTEEYWENTLGIEDLQMDTEYAKKASEESPNTCYRYSGEDANIEFFNTTDDIGNYGVYNDFQDCVANNVGLGQEKLSGYSRIDNGKVEKADGILDGDYEKEDGKEIRTGEVSETTPVKNGQFVAMDGVKAEIKNFLPTKEDK